MFSKIKNFFNRNKKRVSLKESTDAIMESLHIENGHYEVIYRSNAALYMMAHGFYEMVKNAENYLEISMAYFDADKGVEQAMVVTIQKADKKTPHQFRKELEVEVAKLKKEIEDLRQGANK